MELILERRVSESDTLFLAQEILQLSSSYHLFIFKGNLGAGKTSLIKHFCKLWEVTDEVSSPTFGLVNLYQTKSSSIQVCHADLYRLKQAEELESVGIWEYLDDPAIKSCIEWPELMLHEISIPYFYIEILHTEGTDRLYKVFSCNI